MATEPQRVIRIRNDEVRNRDANVRPCKKKDKKNKRMEDSGTMMTVTREIQETQWMDRMRKKNVTNEKENRARDAGMRMDGWMMQMRMQMRK